MKLYEKQFGGDEYANFVKVVLRLMEVEYLSVTVAPTDEELLKKSMNGKFPVLELKDEKTTLCEPLSIARFVADGKLGFYGPDLVTKSQVDQWIDIISMRVAPASHQLIQQVCGFKESEQKQFSIELNQFKIALGMFEKHFKLRNFMVGYQLTLADVWLIVNLIAPYQMLFDKKVRD